jgi:hypothetical protein
VAEEEEEEEEEKKKKKKKKKKYWTREETYAGPLLATDLRVDHIQLLCWVIDRFIGHGLYLTENTFCIHYKD